MHIPVFHDPPEAKEWTDPRPLSDHELNWYNEQLRAIAPTSERLCQVIMIKLAGCSGSINFCKPESLMLGDMDEGASFRLLHYAHLEPFEAFLHIKKIGNQWESFVTREK